MTTSFDRLGEIVFGVVPLGRGAVAWNEMWMPMPPPTELVSHPRLGSCLHWIPDRLDLVDTPPAGWDNCLNAFVRLPLAPEPHRAVYRFARTYGPLGLCEHAGSWRKPAQPRRRCEICGDTEFQYSNRERLEPIEVWLAAARQLRAVTGIAAAMRNDDSTRPGDFKALQSPQAPFTGPDKASSPRSTPTEQWGAVLFVRKSWWLDACDFGPQAILWPDGHYDPPAGLAGLKVSPRNLRGVLALQLETMLGSKYGLTPCSTCATQHMRKRKPSPGQPAYCPYCREERNDKRSHRLYRQNNPEVRRQGRHDRNTVG